MPVHASPEPKPVSPTTPLGGPSGGGAGGSTSSLGSANSQTGLLPSGAPAADPASAVQPPAAANGALRRELGVVGAVGLGLSSILGTGVFVSIGLAAQVSGSLGVLIAISLACVTATCNALNSAQLAAAYPVSGGTYEYAYRLVHPLVGFMAGWMFLCAKIASGASAAVGFASYLLMLTRGNLFSSSATTIAPPSTGLVLGIAVGLILLLTAIVYFGLKLSNRANWAILSLTLSSLLFFSLVGLSAVHAPPESERWTSPKYPDRSPAINILEASALMFVAFTGYGRVATLGDEVREPRVTIPRAIIATLIVSGALYLGVGAVAVLAAPSLANLAPTVPGVAPLSTVALAAFPPALRVPAAAIVAIGAMAAMAGVLLNLVLGLSRMVLAMARRGDMPAVFMRIDARTGSPGPAVLLIGGALAATVLGTYGALALTWTFSAVTVLLYYAVCHLAALKLDDARRRFGKAWAYAGIVFCVSLAVFVDAKTWAAAAIVLAVGLAWHGGMQKAYGEAAEMGPAYKRGRFLVPAVRGGEVEPESGDE
ncbi:hypothetical protein H9P43_006427 [Blastocladiella emersonii ATCC 22665]|nr:hypothetical protein H9P43_006427 [Blastocladiella emersonii ATCC 22665]